MRNSKSYLFEVIYEIFSKEIRLFFFFLNKTWKAAWVTILQILEIKPNPRKKIKSTLFPLSRNALHSWLSRVYQIKVLK